MRSDTDFVRLHLLIGVTDIPCHKLGFDWPPPEKIFFPIGEPPREAFPGDEETFTLVQVRMSQLPDEVAKLPYIARGAEYRYVMEVPDDV